MQDCVGDTLGSLTSVSYRDAGSADLHRKLFPTVSATWMPDALFAWAQPANGLNAPDAEGFGATSEGLPIPLQRRATRPMVSISGTSAVIDKTSAKRDIRATGGMPSSDVGLELAEASARG